MESNGQISDQISQKQTVIISKDQLEMILKTFEIIREEETYFCGKIRLLKKHDQYMIQEESNTREIILRRFPTQIMADEFINQRLETYENMWNGCGCKVNYYD